MKLIIEYKDKETKAPQVIVDDDGNVQRIIFDVPFALAQKPRWDENEERELTIMVGQKKKCTGPCKEERTEAEFHYAANGRDGKQNVCIYCKKLLDRERRRRILEAEDETE